MTIVAELNEILLYKPEAKSQKMYQTGFRLPLHLANVSWFYLTETPIETIT